MRPTTLAALILASTGIPLCAAAAQTRTMPVAGTILGGGQPVHVALVRLVTTDSERVVVETKSTVDGKFKLASVPTGQYWLEVRRMGFLRRRVALTVDSARVDTLRVDLESFVSQCGETTPAVLVEIRDATSRASIARGARLDIAMEGSLPVDHIVATDTTSDGPLVAGSSALPGTYRVVVSVPGYRSWERDNIVVRPGMCGPHTVFLRAELKPETRTLVAQTPPKSH